MSFASIVRIVRRAAWGTRRARVSSSALLVAALALGARAGAPQPVAAYVAERRPLVQRLVASGRVMAPARVALASLSLARVVEVTVREGDAVRAGQLLVRLDDAEARASLAQARARVEEARARLELVRRTASRTAAEAVHQADLRLAHAERTFERTRRLVDAGAAAAAQLDEADDARAAARGEARRAAIEAASLAATGADRRLAAAALRQAQAAEAVARARLADKEIRAPADGRVLVRDVEAGDVVQAGKTVLVVAEDGPARLTIRPDERHLAVLAEGQQAEAVADAFPGETFRAVVAYVAPAVDPARGVVEVRLAVPDPPAFLRPDMTVSVNVTVGRKHDALLVPDEAVRDAATAPWVLRIEAGHASRRAVTLGARGEGMIEVVEGLAPGDAVALPSGSALAAGARVRVQTAPAELARAL